MSEPVIRGIVLTHGALAAGLVDAVQQITGLDEDALIGRSNLGHSPESFRSMVRELIGQHPTVLFTDLPSGSCTITARRLAREIPKVLVISGVNLPLLLDFVLHRELPIDELGQRLVDRGRAAISLTSV